MSKRGQVRSASPLGKSGQVTVFLIIGIVMLLLAAAFFFIFSEMREAPLEVESGEARASLDTGGTLQSFVENCIRRTVDPSIYLLAIQGGVIYPDEGNPILLTDHGLVNYAWLNGIRGISREKMQDDLARYLEENIDFCFAGFETFARQQIVVVPDYEEIDAEVLIQNSLINAELMLPTEIRFPNGDIQTLDRFSVQLQSRLGELVGLVETLDYPDVQPQDFIDIPYQPVILPFDESITLYSLSRADPQEPLSFLFAVRDDFPENKAPVLEFIPDKTFTVGDVWVEEINAEDPNNDILTFSSDSNLFPVNEDGTIDLQMAAAGIFDVTFMVEDGRGGEDQQLISILVLENEQ